MAQVNVSKSDMFTDEQLSIIHAVLDDNPDFKEAIRSGFVNRIERIGETLPNNALIAVRNKDDALAERVRLGLNEQMVCAVLLGELIPEAVDLSAPTQEQSDAVG